MRSLKKIALVCMMVMCFCILCSVKVSAIGLEEKLSIYDGSTLIDGDYAEDTETILTRGNLLSSGMSTVQDKGSRVVAVGGTTTCHQTCDKVICNLYLEQLDDDGNWYTYKFWNLYTTNAASYSPSKTVSVEGGHWYRARGAHSAIKSGTTESVTTTTDGIYIS